MNNGPFYVVFLTEQEGDRIAEILNEYVGPIVDVCLAAQFCGQWTVVKEVQKPTFIGHLTGPCDVNPISDWGI